MPAAFAHPVWLHLLWIAALAGAVGLYGLWRARRSLRAFADAHLLPHLGALPGIARRRRLGLGCVVVCLALLAVALAGPGGRGARTFATRRDLDILVLLDVSRSMLAEDVKPNRLARAKLAVGDDLLRALAGERIGLLTFAGTTSRECPLTSDYAFFRLALQDVSTTSVPRGGTLLGDALRAAPAAFPEAPVDTPRLVLLITDGGDQGSFPVAAAAQLWQTHGMPMLVVALGDEDDGAPVPPRFADDAEAAAPVISRAEMDLLREIAAAGGAERFAATGGMNFIPAGTRAFDLGEIYTVLAQPALAASEGVAADDRAGSGWYLFTLAGFLLLATESLWPVVKRPSARPFQSAGVVDAPPEQLRPGSRASRPQKRPLWVAALVALLALAPSPLADPLKAGASAFAAGDFEAALQHFSAAAEVVDAEQRFLAQHNEATSLLALGRIAEARALWESLTGAEDPATEAHVRFGLGNCAYAAALRAIHAPDFESARVQLETAGAQYREVLRLDPSFADARVNLELAHRLWERLPEPEKDAQQQNPQDEPGEGEGGEESEAPKSTPPAADPEPDTDRNQSPPESPDRPPARPPGAPPQPPSPPDQSGKDQSQQMSPVETSPPPALTPAQAERLLEQVREAERARRQMLREQRSVRREPVKDDW